MMKASAAASRLIMSSSVFVMRRRWCDVAAFKESLLFDLAANLFGRPRIHVLHLVNFVIRELRQPADEMHQLPALAGAFRGPIRPCRHAGKANAVFDNPEQLGVCQIL